jgi:hypothetical protein
MFVVVPVLLAVSAVFSAWWSWRWRVRLRSRLRDEWGRSIPRERDMEGVADFYRTQDEAGDLLDDRTWDDLLMDDVFAWLDRTQSRIGQQILYRRLRSAPVPRALDAFDALAVLASEDATRRMQAQTVLARLQSPAGYYVHRLAQPDVLGRPRWHVVFPIWTAAAVSTMAIAFAVPALGFAGVLCFVVNFGIRVAVAHRAMGLIAWFRQLGPLLSVANELSRFGTEETRDITGTLSSDLTALKLLGAIARWVSRDPAVTDALTLVVLELLNVLFLLDANALYFATSELQAHGRQLLNVIEAAGEIDAAIAVASFRQEAEQWVRPRFVDREAPASFLDLRHPLVDDAVPNSITLAPPHGVLVTGSNMSGKSTFLRTVGVNVVLAQTVNTCLARAYQAPVYQVRSCIGRADDLIAGKSYYLVEVESVLALVKASDSTEPHLFIFDELFRGTNAVERIAAGEAVLRALVSGGKPHVVLTATHDGELVDLLRDAYDVYHLGDGIGPDGLTFDYHLTPGPATSRNAIALLKLNGAPESLVSRALDRAAILDKQRQLQSS